MKTPHKHAELIKAWADGAVIECRVHDGDSWSTVDEPGWVVHYQYRIKPEPKPDVVEFALVRRYHRHRHCAFSWRCGADESYNLRLTFDGETGALKAAEVLK